MAGGQHGVEKSVDPEELQRTEVVEEELKCFGWTTTRFFFGIITS